MTWKIPYVHLVPQCSGFPMSKCDKDPWSQGLRYLKVTFKHKLDSKDGPSCFHFYCWGKIPMK